MRAGNPPLLDLFGNQLGNDALGADLKVIVVAPDGMFWMVDEYRPAIYHFDSTGKLIERYVPQGTAATGGQPAGTFGGEALPAVLGQFRRANRGFEAVAFDPGVKSSTPSCRPRSTTWTRATPECGTTATSASSRST